MEIARGSGLPRVRRRSCRSNRGSHTYQEVRSDPKLGRVGARPQPAAHAGRPAAYAARMRWLAILFGLLCLLIAICAILASVVMGLF